MNRQIRSKIRLSLFLETCYKQYGFECRGKIMNVWLQKKRNFLQYSNMKILWDILIQTLTNEKLWPIRRKSLFFEQRSRVKFLFYKPRFSLANAIFSYLLTVYVNARLSSIFKWYNWTYMMFLLLSLFLEKSQEYI